MLIKISLKTRHWTYRCRKSATGAAEGQISHRRCVRKCCRCFPDANSWRLFVPCIHTTVIKCQGFIFNLQRWTAIWHCISPTSLPCSCAWYWNSRRYSCWCGPKRQLGSVWTVSCWSSSGKNFTVVMMFASQHYLEQTNVNCNVRTQVSGGTHARARRVVQNGKCACFWTFIN